MRRLISACALVATGAAVLLAGAPARAASAPAIVFAGTSSTPGSIQLYATAEAHVASLELHVIDPATDIEVADVTDWVLASGDDTAGYWHNATLLGLPLGIYRLDGEITDGDGVHVETPNVGQLYSFVQMSFTNVALTGKVTYAHRAITVSGRLVGTWPDGTVRPIGDWPVEVMTYRGGPFDTVTGPDGTFSTEAAIQDVDEFVYMYTLDKPDVQNYAQAYADAGNVTVTQSPTRLTMALSTRKALAGDQVTVSGRLTWKSPTGWTPTADAYIVVMRCDPDGTNCGGVLTTTTSDADGHYTATFPAYQTGVVQVGTHNADPFITSDTFATKPLTVLQPTAISDFSGERISPTQVTLTGHLAFLTGFEPRPIPVEIQYSRTGTGDWHTAQTVDLSNNEHNPEGIRFTVTLDSSTGLYWRAYYAGTPTFFASATGPVAYVA